MLFFWLRIVCCSLPLLGISPSTLAGPWEIGSTNPSKTKKIKIEFTRKHTDSKDTYGFPILKFAAPFSDDLSFEAAAGYGAVDTPQRGSRGGAKDITAKLMWRFIGKSGNRPAFLLEPKFSFDTGDTASGVGAGVTTLKMPLRAGKQFGKVRLTAEVFHTHGFKHAYTDIVGYGGLIEYSPHERWIVGIDLLNDHPLHDGGAHHLRSNAAVKLKATSRIELQALVGRSVENRRGESATNVKFVASFKF